MPDTYSSETSGLDSMVIAQVLGRAHQTAEAHNETTAARMILHVAHSFADELARTDTGFDRGRFIKAATGSES